MVDNDPPVLHTLTALSFTDSWDHFMATPRQQFSVNGRQYVVTIKYARQNYLFLKNNNANMGSKRIRTRLPAEGIY